MPNRSRVRDILISLVMIMAASIVLLNPAKKERTDEKLHLAGVVPETFNGWFSHTYDTSNYSDQWQSINELLVREYVKEKGILVRTIDRLVFVFEYSSDLRKNYSLHFPENCHRAAGNEIEFLKPVVIELAPGKSVEAKCLFIRGKTNSFENVDKIVIYWLVIDGKQYDKTFDIKMEQIFSGLLKQSKQGFLVRFDYSDDLKYSPGSIAKGKSIITGFIKELYIALDENKRAMVFGAKYSSETAI